MALAGALTLRRAHARIVLASIVLGGTLPSWRTNIAIGLLPLLFIVPQEGFLGVGAARGAA